VFLHQAVVPTSHCQSIGFLVLISAESQVGDSVAVRASLVDPRGGLSGIGRMEGIQNIIHRPWRVVFVLPFSFSFFDCFFLTDVPVQPGYLWRKKKRWKGEKEQMAMWRRLFHTLALAAIWPHLVTNKHSMGVSARFPFWNSRPSRGVGILAGVVDTEMREIGDWRHQRDGTGHRVACRCARDLVSGRVLDCWVPSWLLSWAWSSIPSRFLF